MMNYPAYIGETAADPEHHEKNLGLGYKYGSEEVVYFYFLFGLDKEHMIH